MNQQNNQLAIAIGIALGTACSNVNATQLTSSILTFVLGVKQTVSCNYGTTPPCNKASYAVTDVVGSWFSMDTNVNGPEASEKTPIGSFTGVRFGQTQSASNSHNGGIDGSELPNIDNPWTFFGNTGMHQTTVAPTVISDLGSTKVIDFSGWNVTWNNITSIPLIATSPVTITCDTSSCSSTSNYTVDGAFHVTGAGFTTVDYALHLEGNVTEPALITCVGSTLATPNCGNGVCTTAEVEALTGAENTGRTNLADTAFDFACEGVGMGGTATVILPLGTPITAAVDSFDKFLTVSATGVNDVWTPFVVDANNSIATASSADNVLNPGDCDDTLVYVVGINTGDDCLQLTGEDGGPNDDGPMDGDYVDASALTFATPAQSQPNLSSSTSSSCSIAKNPVSAGERSEWWLLAGFLGWLGWNRRKTRRH